VFLLFVFSSDVGYVFFVIELVFCFLKCVSFLICNLIILNFVVLFSVMLFFVLEVILCS
jgi:hypothetical protein